MRSQVIAKNSDAVCSSETPRTVLVQRTAVENCSYAWREPAQNVATRRNGAKPGDVEHFVRDRRDFSTSRDWDVETETTSLRGSAETGCRKVDTYNSALSVVVKL